MIEEMIVIVISIGEIEIGRTVAEVVDVNMTEIVNVNMTVIVNAVIVETMDVIDMIVPPTGKERDLGRVSSGNRPRRATSGNRPR